MTRKRSETSQQRALRRFGPAARCLGPHPLRTQPRADRTHCPLPPALSPAPQHGGLCVHWTPRQPGGGARAGGNATAPGEPVSALRRATLTMCEPTIGIYFHVKKILKTPSPGQRPPRAVCLSPPGGHAALPGSLQEGGWRSDGGQLGKGKAVLARGTHEPGLNPPSGLPFLLLPSKCLSCGSLKNNMAVQVCHS